ncbi:hypothetical protein SuNHUV7_22310 (plasmid) [Pseudoseohaeicola sp. NH-UV-7]|uniref:hypothetical protein n=1 Tax=Sulfitobacter sp. TBRI5 TaxID=2989732 RepID=UPI003A6B1455
MTPYTLRLENMLSHVLQPYEALGMLDIQCRVRGDTVTIRADAGDVNLICRTIPIQPLTSALFALLIADGERLQMLSGRHGVCIYSSSGQCAAMYEHRDRFARVREVMT